MEKTKWRLLFSLFMRTKKRPRVHGGKKNAKNKMQRTKERKNKREKIEQDDEVESFVGLEGGRRTKA